MPVQSRWEIVTWVGSNIVPHEGTLRSYLRQMAVPECEVNDIIQDAYVRISALNSVAHIRSGRAYLFTTARHVMLDRVRRERIVPIDSIADMDVLLVASEDPGPERRVSARLELERVRRLIDGLPDLCRKVFELRRIEGISQREIATQLGLPEHTVEAQAHRGLKLILKQMVHGDDLPETAHRDDRGQGGRDERRR